MSLLHNHSLKHPRATRGFSLIELLVAMTISLFLLAGVISMFSGSKSSYETNDRISRVQENGRFALDQIVTDIRAAGYPGCARAVSAWNTALNDSTTLPWNFGQPITGFDAQASGWSPTIDSAVSSPIAGNDVLVLRVPRRGATSVDLKTAMASPTDTLDVNTTSATAFAQGDVVRIMSCAGQALLQVTAYAAGSTSSTITHTIGGATATAPGNLTADIGFQFPAGAQVIPVNTVVYYIHAATAGGGNALWRVIGLNPAEELVEGIDAMQVLYGVNTDNDAANTADIYSNAKTVTDNAQWGEVVSVKVALLVRSLDEYGSNVDNTTYTLLSSNPSFNNVVGPYNDRRIRKLFTTTATLRNRAS